MRNRRRKRALAVTPRVAVMPVAAMPVAAMLVAVLLLAAGCASSAKVVDQADREARRGNWDAAVAYYQQAVQQDPDNSEAYIKLEQAKLKAAAQHLKNGRQFREEGDLEQALLEYELAVRLNPANELAARELQEVRAAYAAEREQALARPTPTEEAMERDRQKPLPIPQIEPAVTGPISLDFPRASVQEVYRALGRIAGVNVVFAPGLDNPTTSFQVDDITFDEAIRVLTASVGHFAKPLNASTLLIAQDNQTNRRSYADQVMKTFYLSNARAENVAQLLRALLQARSIAENADLNSVTVRDTPEVVELARRIVDQTDKAPGEVLLDIEILEVNRQVIEDYGLSLSTYGTGAALNEPNAAGNTRISLDALERINDSNIFLTIPSVLYQFLKENNNFRLIANPKLRTSVGQETSLLIGERVPVVNTTFNPQQTLGGNVVPISSTTFEDVGIVIAAQTQVHHNGEISLVLQLEVSSVIGQQVIQNTQLPIFSTRSLGSTIRLRDGETNILAGLIRDDERMRVTGFPGLVDLPIVGRLFAANRNDVQQTDIIMSITPHILRTAHIREEDLEAVYVGTEANIGGAGAALAGRRAPPTQRTGAAGAEDEEEPAYLWFEPDDHVVRPGQEITMDVEIEDGRDVASAGMRITFDPNVIEFLEAREGEFLQRGGVETSFQTASAGAGALAVGMTRVGEQAGVDGSGVLLTLAFRAVAPGFSEVDMSTFVLRDPGGRSLPVEGDFADVEVEEEE